MKKFALVLCIAALGLAGVANAQNPDLTQSNALGLGWGGCSTLNAAGALNQTFACANEAVLACRTFNLQGSFVASLTDPRFAGSTCVVDVLIGSTPTIGQWWAGFGIAGCRASAVSTAANGPATNPQCQSLYPPGTSTGPGLTVLPGAGAGAVPNRIRLVSSNSIFPTQQLTTGTRAITCTIALKTDGTLADCDPAIDPTPVCTDGCTTGACWVLNNVDLFMEVDGNPATPDIIRYESDGVFRNYATYQGGTGGNCPGATPTKSSTWGAVKALYR